MANSDATDQIQFEKLAACQHDIWAHWMKYLFSVSLQNVDQSETIPADFALRWKRQMEKPYEALTEREKDGDREQAMKIIAVVQDFLDGL